MAIMGNKTYQSDSFNLGGDKRMEFILAADKENPDYFMFMTQIDDLWIRLVSDNVYRHMKAYQNSCTGCNFDDPGNFACTIKYSIFKNLLLVGEAVRLQDYAEALWVRLVDLKLSGSIKELTSMAVNFTSTSNDNHFITVLRYGDMITINCKTNDVPIEIQQR